MPSTLSQDQKNQLAELLRHVKEKDKGFLPDEAIDAFCGVRPLGVVEVCIYDNDGRFVLKHRSDKDFVGWHFPGGTLRNGEHLHTACKRHVLLDKVATDVTDIQLIGAHAYQPGEHPYQLPLINFIACKAVDLTESETCRWFSDTPPDIIQNAPHAKYVEVFKRWFQGDRTRSAEIF